MPAPPASGRILVVDDEPSVRESVGYALEPVGFDVTLAVDGEDAETKIDATSFDLLILDIMMPGKSGLDICREVRSMSPVPIILLTAPAGLAQGPWVPAPGNGYLYSGFSRKAAASIFDKTGEVIELGPVNRTIHQVNECVAVADLDRLGEMYGKIVEKLLGK